MPFSLTDESKNNNSFVNEDKDDALIWDEATMIWDEANRTWDSPGRPYQKTAENSNSLTNESKT